MAERTGIEKEFIDSAKLICKNCQATNALTQLHCCTCQDLLLPEIESGFARQLYMAQPEHVECSVVDPTLVGDAVLIHLRGLLYIVAEQIGGSPGTPNLARQATTLIRDFYYAADLLLEPAHALAAAFDHANQVFYEHYNQNRPANQRYGVSCVAAVLNGQDLITAHLGDCRAYLLRQNQLALLTLDHSWGREIGERLLQQHVISNAEYQAREFELTRCLGLSQQINCDTATYHLEATDRLLLCNRGVWRELGASTIQDELSRPAIAQTQADELLRQSEPSGQSVNRAALIMALRAAGPQLDYTTLRYSEASPDFADNPVIEQHDPIPPLIELLQGGEFAKVLPALQQHAHNNPLAAKHLKIVRHLLAAAQSRTSNNFEQLQQAHRELEAALALITEGDLAYVYPFARLNLRGICLRLAGLALKTQPPQAKLAAQYWRRFTALAGDDFTADERTAIAALEGIGLATEF